MASETKGLDALDPLARFSILSLFPRTLGVPQTAPQPSDFEQDLDSIHNHVKSLASKSPKKLLDQAKAVMEENKQLNIKVLSNAAQDSSELIVTADNNPKKRRLGLDPKLPHFSLNPDLSQPSVNLEPSFDIDDYEDPNEYFAAYERFENSKKAIQKQTGTSQKDNVHFTSSQEVRTRRPGLGLDRKRPQFSLKSDLSQPSVNLEPSFDIDDYEDPNEYFAAYERFEHIKKEIQKQTGASQKDNVHFTSSQEVRTRRPGLGRSYKNRFIESDIFPQELLAKNTNAPSSADLQESVKLCTPSKERDVTGSEKEVDKGNGTLNELLSKNLEDLEGDGAINHLKKHLQMEDFTVEPLCLPEMVSKRASFGNTIKPRRALSDIQNLSKGVLHSSDANHSGTVRSTITIADDNAPAEVGTYGTTLEHSVHAHDDTVRRSFNQEHSHGAGSIHINDDPTNTICGFDFDQTVRDDEMNIADSSLDVLGQLEATIPSESFPNRENLNCKENTIAKDLEEPPVCSVIEEQPKDGSSKDADSAPEQQVEEPTQSPANGKSKGKLRARKSNKRKAPSSDENPEDILNPATVDCENANASPEEPIEEAPRETLNRESKLEQRKQKQQRMKLDSSRRQSFSGAGTKWEKCKLKKGKVESEEVVRRSTRIRSRPLAHWKGERFLYGRVHESLSTVIGVKSFSSPGDDGKPSLKVKSFVDDKFNDLVEFAGLH